MSIQQNTPQRGDSVMADLGAMEGVVPGEVVATGERYTMRCTMQQLTLKSMKPTCGAMATTTRLRKSDNDRNTRDKTTGNTR